MIVTIMTGIVDFVKYTLVLLMFIMFVYEAYFMVGTLSIPGVSGSFGFPEVKYNADPWYDRVVTPGEMESTGWIIDNTNTSDRFVADIFGAELIMGMTARSSTTGGDWANAPNPVKLMGDTNLIYNTEDAQVAHDKAVEDNASYVFLPNRNTFSGYEWTYGNHTKFDDQRYFSLLYQNPDVTIYRVLP